MGLIHSGEWWRTITALFLHANGAHLLNNLVFGTLFLVCVASSRRRNVSPCRAGSRRCGKCVEPWSGRGHTSVGPDRRGGGRPPTAISRTGAGRLVEFAGLGAAGAGVMLSHFSLQAGKPTFWHTCSAFSA
jgi:hypothetical protein